VLARLVVHLQAQYGNLTSGLKVARTQTAVAAQSIRQSVDGITSGAVSLSQLETRAHQAATGLDAIATAADVVDHTLHGAAFSAELLSGSLTRVGSMAGIVGSGAAALDKSTSMATGGLQTVAAAAGRTQPVLGSLSTTTKSAAGYLRLTAGAARSVGGAAAIAGQATRAAAHGIHYFATTISAAITVIELLYSALLVLLIPLRVIGAVAAFGFRTFGRAVWLALLPLRLLWSGLILTAKAIWAVVGPLASVGLTILKVWFILRGFIATWKMIFHWLNLLPPKLRILVGALLALGLLGRAGAVAMRIFAGAVRLAATGVQILLLPIQLIRNPMAAAASAANLLGRAVLFAGGIARRSAGAFWTLSASVGGFAKQGIAAAVGSVSRLGASLVSASMHAAAFGAIAGVVLGVKLASAAETSRVVFGTMLHDMEQGKALLEQLQGSKVAPFFDAKQIQDAGRDLLKAKVPVDQITGRLEQLGGIAMATKTPIEDLSRIYRQGMARGAFQTDLVNQMAERGIDIYAALTAVTGKSGQALAEMMSAGKIGSAEMNAAIDHMTLGHGIYAGVVDNVAKTTAGMWSTATNNISMALQTMFGMALEGNGALLQSFVNVTEQIKARAVSIGPVILQLSQMIIGIFLGLRSVVSTVWTTIFGQTQTTFAGMLTSTMEWVTKFRWFFTNIVPIVQFAGLMITLLMVTAFEDIAYWLTTKLPAYLTWFSNNWQAVFRDIAVGTMTVFSNLAGNIKNAMTQIWAFIKSGGTADLQLTWTPLLDGFKSTVSQLPDVPNRAMSALEEGLQSQIETIGTGLADSFDAMMAEANQSMVAAAAVPPPVALQSTPVGGDSADGSNADGAAGKDQKQNDSPLLKGSREATAAIFAAMRQTDDRKQKLAEKSLKEQEKATAATLAMQTQLAAAPTIAIVESL
jgi:tape measure domain-containing protein